MTAIAWSTSSDLGSDLRVRDLDSGPTLPLVLSPRRAGPRDPRWLTAWVRDHRSGLDQALIEHGAILFRGFGVTRPEDFESVALAFEPGLGRDYLGTSPRNAVTDYVFTASELPPHYPIPQHCEMSFLAHPPRNLFFYAHRPNDGAGGETPLCDFRAVWRDLDPVVRARFEQRGVRHIRNYVGPGKTGRDLWKLKRWDEMFQTTDRALVEAKCRENGIEFEWIGGGQPGSARPSADGDRLRLTNVQPAARPHPDTGEPVWFNHAQVFHLSAASGELKRVARRPGQARSAFFAALAAGLVAVKRRTSAPEAQAMHTTFGDGSEISDSDMEAVRDAIWKNLVAYPWQRGDIVLIDNAAVSHGRFPYRGPREVHVAWGPAFGRTRADLERGPSGRVG